MQAETYQMSQLLGAAELRDPWGQQEKADVPKGPLPPAPLPWKLQWVCTTVGFKLKTLMTVVGKWSKKYKGDIM